MKTEQPSVPNSVGHMGTTTVTQPNAVVSEFTSVFTLDVCTQCLKHLTVMADTDLLLFDLKSSSRGPSFSKNTDTYDLFSSDWVKWGVPVTHLLFSCGFKMGKPNLITCHNMQKNCITNMVKIQYSSNNEICLPVDVRPSRNIPGDIHDNIQLHAP